MKKTGIEEYSTTLKVPIIRQWLADMEADGWEIEDKIASDSENHWEASKDGFKVMASIYPDDQRFTAHCYLAAWGPDGLAIDTGEVYSMDYLRAQLTTCYECGAIGPTVRLAFANRVCPTCRQKLIPEYEFPGWCK